MNHAENETITHQDPRASEGRNERGRKAAACPPSRRGCPGQASEDMISRIIGKCGHGKQRFCPRPNLSAVTGYNGVDDAVLTTAAFVANFSSQKEEQFEYGLQ